MASTTTQVRSADTAPLWRRLLFSAVVTGAIWGVILLVAAVVLQGANVIKSGLASWQAIALFAGAVVVAVAVRFGVTRLTGSLLAGRLAQLVPLAVLIWFAIVPLVRETTVDEALPTAAAASALPNPSVASAPAAPTAPAELGRGSFQPLDHSVAGEAVLLDLGGGTKAVRFENFTVQPGPDYVVYVVGGRDVQRPDGGTELGKLKGTRGSQNYELPAQAVGSGPVTVLIWCRAFQVPIANATVGS